MEDYKKKYEQALGRARTFSQRWQGIEATDSELALQELKEIFSELKESEEEDIRKSIIGFLKTMSSLKDGKTVSNEDFDSVALLEWAAWLEKQDEQKPIISDDAIREGVSHFGITQYQITNWLKKYIDVKKQGEQKPSDKVEPKFKAGDWIVSEYGNVNTVNQVINVEQIDDECFGYTLDDKTYFGGSWESSYRLWTIQDAKDGDVLSFSDKTIVIFKDLYNATTFHSYCHIKNNIFYISKDSIPDWWNGEKFHPATKEQRDLLFQKMKEAGYEWDAEKKELRKIEQKPAWSEEDEKMWTTISDLLWEGYKLSDQEVSWDEIRCWILPKVEFFKDRVQIQKGE